LKERRKDFAVTRRGLIAVGHSGQLAFRNHEWRAIDRAILPGLAIHEMQQSAKTPARVGLDDRRVDSAPRNSQSEESGGFVNGSSIQSLSLLNIK